MVLKQLREALQTANTVYYDNYHYYYVSSMKLGHISNVTTAPNTVVFVQGCIQIAAESHNFDYVFPSCHTNQMFSNHSRHSKITSHCMITI